MPAVGINEQTRETSAGGIGGFFGQKEAAPEYSAQHVHDNTTEGNKMALNAMIDNLRKRQIRPAQMQGVQAGPAAQLNVRQSDQARAKQNAMLDSLIAASNGQGPSAANATLQQATDRNLNAALATAAASGGNPAAYRQAAFNRAQITQDAAAQSAALRANEIAAARGQAVQAAQGIRDQDIGVAGQNAQLAQQTALTNAGLAQDTGKTNLLSRVEQERTKDEMVAKLQAQGFTLDEAERQAEIQQRQFNASLLAQQEAARRGVAAQNTASATQSGAAVIGAIGTALAASDERAKKNIADGHDSIGKFLDSLSAKEYDYKDPAKHGDGRRTGIMAQDLEKSDVGKRLVSAAPDGTKMVDINKSTMAALASLASINKRLRELEASRG